MVSGVAAELAAGDQVRHQGQAVRVGRFEGVAALAVVALGATIAGWSASLYYFYPSYYVFYAALGLLVLELALRIAALPKKAAEERPAKRLPGRAKTKRGTNLVAVRKTADQDAATPTEK